MAEPVQGITSHALADVLRSRRDNDVFIELIDADEGEATRSRAVGVRYDPDSDTIVIDAQAYYP